MSKFEKLQKNIDNKLLTIKYIGSRGEGVSNLTTEINYRVDDYTFFIPFTLPDEIVVIKPTFSNSEGVRANLVEIKSPSPKRIDPKCEHFFNVADVYFSIEILKIIPPGKLIKFLFQYLKFLQQQL